MKKLIAVAGLCLLAVALAAQTTYTPPTLPPLFSVANLGNSAQLMTDVNANVKTYTDLLVAHDAAMHGSGGYDSQIAAATAGVKNLTDQSAAVTALKTQLAADEATIATQQTALTALTARVTALETKLGAMQTKVASAGTTLAAQ